MKKDLLVAVIAIAAVAGLCYGLVAIHPAYSAVESHPVASAAAPTAASIPGTVAAPATDEKWVLRVNGEPVTEKQIQMLLEQAPPEMRQMYESPQGRQAIAEQVIKMKVLEQEGRRLGLDRDSEVANRTAMDRTNVIAQLALRKLVPNPTEAELRAIYEKEPARTESVEISHILIAIAGGQAPARSGKPLSVADGMAKAQIIEQQLKAGRPFAELAQAVSDDAGSAQQGGNLGKISHGMMPPELDNVAFSLKPGEVSPPVRSPFGIHIFKAGARGKIDFEQVRPMLTQDVQRRALDQKMADLMKNAKVERDEKFFNPVGRAPVVPQRMPKNPS